MFCRETADVVVNDPKGTGYLTKVISILPPRFWEGKRTVDEMINTNPFGERMPGYHFLGPGTKLKERS
jgi:hypothetical protein